MYDNFVISWHIFDFIITFDRYDESRRNWIRCKHTDCLRWYPFVLVCLTCKATESATDYSTGSWIFQGARSYMKWMCARNDLHQDVFFWWLAAAHATVCQVSTALKIRADCALSLLGSCRFATGVVFDSGILGSWYGRITAVGMGAALLFQFAASLRPLFDNLDSLGARNPNFMLRSTSMRSKYLGCEEDCRHFFIIVG